MTRFKRVFWYSLMHFLLNLSISNLSCFFAKCKLLAIFIFYKKISLFLSCRWFENYRNFKIWISLFPESSTLTELDYKSSKKQKKFLRASRGGLVVKVDDSWLSGPGFKPPPWRTFFRYHSFGSKLGTKIVENSNLALLHVL